jgi:peptide/nickel transport system substrate-binding protein
VPRVNRGRSGRAAVVLAGVALVGLVVLHAAPAKTHRGSRYGGVLTVGVSTEPGALDPIRQSLSTALEVYRTFCQKLYDLDARGNVVPQLAAGLPVVSKDKLTVTIPLRKGIQFNDGTPFDADAVVATIERGKNDPLSSRTSDLDPIESVSAAGPNAVVLHLKARYAPLMTVLGMAATAIVSPAQLAKLGDRLSSDPVCVGPFTFDNRVAGDSITVTKSPWYYDRAHVYLDKIVFRVISDPAAAAAALETGDIQALDSVSPSELAAVKETSGLRVLQADSYGWRAIRINLGNRNGVGHLPYSNIGTPLASSPKLRKAFEEAIDRKALARVVFAGDVQPGCTPVSPASPWFDPGITCTPYDPRDARKLVAASGVSDPTVHLLTPTDTDSARLAQFIQGEESAVGIRDVMDAQNGSDDSSSGHFDTALASWTSGVADPDGNSFRFLATSGKQNFGGYSNPRLDLILQNGRKAVSGASRRTLYRAAQQIVLQDRPYIYLYYPTRYAAFSTRVAGVQLFDDSQIRVAFAQLK